MYVLSLLATGHLSEGALKGPAECLGLPFMQSKGKGLSVLTDRFELCKLLLMTHDLPMMLLIFTFLFVYYCVYTTCTLMSEANLLN